MSNSLRILIKGQYNLVSMLLHLRSYKTRIYIYIYIHTYVYT